MELSDGGRELARAWQVQSAPSYALLALGCSLLVRLCSCALKTVDTHGEKERPLHERFWTVFRGFGADVNEDDDYWHPYILGVLELLGLPVLMALGAWTFVGAWIALKTVGNWNYWQLRRAPFNRFLICTALMLLLGFVVMAPRVTVLPAPQPEVTAHIGGRATHGSNGQDVPAFRACSMSLLRHPVN